MKNIDVQSLQKIIRKTNSRLKFLTKLVKRDDKEKDYEN